MNTKIEIDYPRDNNLPENVGWYLVENNVGYSTFVYVYRDREGDLKVSIVGQDRAWDLYVCEYKGWRWSDKIDL